MIEKLEDILLDAIADCIDVTLGTSDDAEKLKMIRFILEAALGRYEES